MGCKVPADMRMIEMLSNQLRADQAILTGTPAFSLDNANYLLDYSHLAQMRMIIFFFQPRKPL